MLSLVYQTRKLVLPTFSKLLGASNVQFFGYLKRHERNRVCDIFYVSICLHVYFGICVYTMGLTWLYIPLIIYWELYSIDQVLLDLMLMSVLRLFLSLKWKVEQPFVMEVVVLWDILWSILSSMWILDMDLSLASIVV